MSKSPDSECAVELARANNDVSLEKSLNPGDFHGLACIAPQRAAAAEDIDRIAGEQQFLGLFVEAGAQTILLGDPSMDVLYEAGEEKDLTVAFHGSAAPTFRYDFPIQNQGLEKPLWVHTLAHLWQSKLAITSLIVQGGPE